MIEYKNSLGLYIQKKRTRFNDFTIISNDCWGAEVYRYLDVEFSTPFIGLFFMAPCYIKLLQNLELNLRSPLRFTTVSKYNHQNEWRLNTGNNYPIGVINNDIEIHFIHFKSEDEAREKWNRRLARINYNKLFIKFDCGKDLCSYQLIEAFESLPFHNKICLSPQPFKEFKSIIYIKHWETDGAKMFLKALKCFDVIGWINNRQIKINWLYRLISFILL
jgi:uncharacterized protein (DUF1919 family)